MYFFVRFNGFITMLFGILLMLGGIAAAVYGFVQNALLVQLANTYLLAGYNIRLLDARFYAALLGLLLFLLGMCVASWGQLMLVFADVAANTREANNILRGLRRQERTEVGHSSEVPQHVPPSINVPDPAPAPAITAPEPLPAEESVPGVSFPDTQS